MPCKKEKMVAKRAMAEKYIDQSKNKDLSREISRNDVCTDTSAHEKEISNVNDDLILAAYET